MERRLAAIFVADMVGYSRLMTATTIELYEALIAAGVNEDAARAAAKSVFSREEAREHLVTKADLERAFRMQNMWIAGLFVGQVAVFTGILALFF